MNKIEKNEKQQKDNADSLSSIFINKIAPIFKEKSNAIKGILKNKVGTTALSAIKDDGIMQDVFGKIYETLPIPARLLIKRESFIKYCIDNRKIVIQMLENKID